MAGAGGSKKGNFRVTQLLNGPMGLYRDDDFSCFLNISGRGSRKISNHPPFITQWTNLSQIAIDLTSKFHIESPSIFHGL